MERRYNGNIAYNLSIILVIESLRYILNEFKILTWLTAALTEGNLKICNE